VIGSDNTSTTSGSGSSGTGGTGTTGGDTTNGSDGTGSGNQTDTGVVAPIDAGGNQVTVIGSGNDNTAPGTSDQPGAPQPGTEDPGTPGLPGSTGTGSTGGSSSSTGEGSTATGGDVQAAAAVAGGVLPQTGAPAHAALIALLGLAILMAGAILLGSARRRGAVVRA
jgi:LPXTG-motif cell wall-anchored protein